MITIFLFVFSALCFIATFGIHAIILSLDKWDQPTYVDNPFLSLIPWLSGLVFSVIPIVIAFELNWILIFLLNAFVAKFLGGFIADRYLRWYDTVS